uniref:Putative trypsin-like serine protease n=1 Tax=Lutzomyia longipalpis TaxID=7200 RepID=A0A1B0GH37_LUTLO
MWIFVLFGGLFLPSILGQGCNYALEVGTTAINISSGLDPKCTWTATTYSDYRLRLTCDVHLPGGINLGIVSNWRALTSQSCVVKYPIVELSLVVGDYNIASTTDTPYMAMYSIESSTCYTNNCNTVPEVENGDIALLKTKNEIQMNPGVGVTCLPYKYKDDSLKGKAVFLVGWTDDSTGFVNRNVEQQGISNVLSSSQCELSYPKATSINMCTFSVLELAPNCLFYLGSSTIYANTENKRLYIVGIMIGTNGKVLQF